MDVAFIAWLLDNVPAKLLHALELVGIVALFFYFRAENKKMLSTFRESEDKHAAKSVEHDVGALKIEMLGLREKMDTGFNTLSTQIANLSNTVISAVSRKG
jgi:hypothetical protein